MIYKKNLLAPIPSALPEETFEMLTQGATCRIERIVSRGHASPPGCWYDQDWNEWVIVLQGRAGLLFEERNQPLTLSAGDYVNIPAHTKHRVEWTDPEQATVWLAVHYA